ncbi:MAG TPA: hypothetical protein ENJ95_01920 [Bacteroidetes bacterium]|nr:hypothetical protein [Bacteroidota bacterium]
MTAFTQEVPPPLFAVGNAPPLPVIDFVPLLKPETKFEENLLRQPEFIKGLNWGIPRFGHPEGKVGYHIREVLDNIDLLNADPATRQRLRIAAMAHDTFKYKESESTANGKRINHGLLARRYMERHTDDGPTLDLIELHDEIYFAWRHDALHGKPKEAIKRLDQLNDRVRADLKLHYLFFRCDTLTGDKIQAPRIWFEQKMAGYGIGDIRKLAG